MSIVEFETVVVIVAGVDPLAMPLDEVPPAEAAIVNPVGLEELNSIVER